MRLTRIKIRKHAAKYKTLLGINSHSKEMNSKSFELQFTKFRFSDGAYIGGNLVYNLGAASVKA